MVQSSPLASIAHKVQTFWQVHSKRWQHKAP